MGVSSRFKAYKSFKALQVSSADGFKAGISEPASRHVLVPPRKQSPRAFMILINCSSSSCTTTSSLSLSLSLAFAAGTGWQLRCGGNVRNVRMHIKRDTVKDPLLPVPSEAACYTACLDNRLIVLQSQIFQRFTHAPRKCTYDGKIQDSNSSALSQDSERQGGGGGRACAPRGSV